MAEARTGVPARAAASSPAPSPVHAGDAASADCASVTAHLRQLLVVEFAPVPGAMATVERALSVAARSCRRDDWPLPMRRCALGVPSWGAGSGTAGLTRCLDEVPPALRVSLTRELGALRE